MNAKRELWFALRVNGHVAAVHETLDEAIENFSSNAHYLVDGEELEKGPITFDVVPVTLVEKAANNLRQIRAKEQA